MAGFINTVAMGNLTRDPVLRNTNKDIPVCQFGLAINRRKGEEPIFLNCVMFGKRAGVIAQYVGKGDTLLVVGYPKPGEWTDGEGKTHKRDDFVLTDFTFTGSRKSDNEPGRAEPQQGPQNVGDKDREWNNARNDDVPF